MHNASMEGSDDSLLFTPGGSTKKKKMKFKPKYKSLNRSKLQHTTSSKYFFICFCLVYLISIATLISYNSCMIYHFLVKTSMTTFMFYLFRPSNVCLVGYISPFWKVSIAQIVDADY